MHLGKISLSISACLLLNKCLLESAYGSSKHGLDLLNAMVALDSKDINDNSYKNFRSTLDPYNSKLLEKVKNGDVHIFSKEALNKKWEDLTEQDKKGVVYINVPSNEGLKELNASGSSQFGVEGLKEITQRIKQDYKWEGTITVVDHRQEPHAFLNERIPFSVYGVADAYSIGLKWQEARNVENFLIDNTLKHSQIKLHEIKEKEGPYVVETRVQHVPVKSVYTEQHLVKALNHMGYMRIGITDHLAPKYEDWNALVVLHDSLPTSVWKHFHCRAGRGRTTTGMVLYDIISNIGNKNLTFEDFVMRHYLLGGVNLLAASSEDDTKKWKAQAAFERAVSIKKFYDSLLAMGSQSRVFYSDNQNEGANPGQEIAKKISGKP